MSNKMALDALTAKKIEDGWKHTFSTNNPFCPCDLKSFTKAVRWAEHEVGRAAIAALQAEPQPAKIDRAYTERLIEALRENSDPVSIDAAEEFERLLATPPKD